MNTITRIGLLAGTLLLLGLGGCATSPTGPIAEQPQYDLVIRGGTVYDGSGGAGRRADVGVVGEHIAHIGAIAAGAGREEVDATGMVVTPGFINMLSWSVESLIQDGRSQSELRQGVTLQVFGEGMSWGPLNESMKQTMKSRQSDIVYEIEWTTLGEYLDWLVARGVATNIASYVGATTVRIHELGFEDRAPSEDELERMQLLVRHAMQEGALGVGSSLIYAPAFYADTDELVALASAAGEYGGGYVSHLRSEGNQLLESVDELIHIARQAGVHAEIYHLKAAGESNWGKMEEVFARVEAARAEGLDITADMYTYTAGATGLDAAMPPWVQEGGYDAWAQRLSDPEISARVIEEMRTPTDDWENLMLAAGSPDRMILVGFKNPELRHLTGRSLADVAAMRGVSAERAAVDLVIEDGSRVGTVYFLMSEENIHRKIAQPWVSFCSDSASQAPEEPFLQSNPHPRAYGSFARLLGKYVREEQVISLAEAVRRLTSLPADNLRIKQRGRLEAGYFADLVVFDPATIQDHATFAQPHQYATGVAHVWVNGVQVIRDGEHTDARPGQVVRGPGWIGENPHLD